VTATSCRRERLERGKAAGLPEQAKTAHATALATPLSLHVWYVSRTGTAYPVFFVISL